MEANEIKLTLKGILETIQKKKTFEVADLTDETKIRDDLALDSVDMLDMVWGIEEKFGISIDNSLFPNMLTIGDVVKTIQDQLAQKPAVAANAS